MNIRFYNEADKFQVQAIFSKHWTDQEFLDELTENLGDPDVSFYVAEENSGIVSVAGFRKTPPHLHILAKTKKPAELYIIASKFQNRGIGNSLGQKILEEAKCLKFTEIICYSPTTHNDSWKFYEKLGFVQHGIVNDPEDGCPGMVWVKVI